MNLLIQITVFFYLITAPLRAEVTIMPNDENIQYSGVLEMFDSPNGREMYRFSQSYIDEGKVDYNDKTSDAEWTQSPARSQTGMVIRIKTSSPKVTFHFTKNSAGGSQYSLFQLFRNGEDQGWVSGGSGDNVTISNSVWGGSSDEPAVWECAFPSLVSHYFNHITIEDGHTLEPLEDEDKPVYVAIGNSITQGVGQHQGKTASTYPYQVAQELGYELYNMGIGGSSINADVIANLESLSPDLITVLWGYNNAIYNPADLGIAMDKYRTLMTQLLTNYPNAKIVAIEQTYTNPELEVGQWNSDNSVTRLRTEQKEILDELQVTYSNLFVVDGLDYTDASSLKDMVHLNDDGAASLAAGLISEIPTFVVGGEVSLNTIQAEETPFHFSLNENNLNLTSNSLSGEINIYNPQGQVVRQVDRTEISNLSLDLNALAQGFYVGTIITSDRINHSFQFVLE